MMTKEQKEMVMSMTEEERNKWFDENDDGVDVVFQGEDKANTIK